MKTHYHLNQIVTIREIAMYLWNRKARDFSWIQKSHCKRTYDNLLGFVYATNLFNDSKICVIKPANHVYVDYIKEDTGYHL